MSRLDPKKLHVTFLSPTTVDSPLVPRCYTLTHSDRTGDLFLTIAHEFNKKQLKGWQIRIMRDEVLAEWLKTEETYSLHVYCQISKGIGTSKFRDRIFRQELPLVLEAFRYGDQALFHANPFLDQTKLWIHFQSKKDKFNKVEIWGSPEKYALIED
ncbi:MAG: staygreen family protein [Candidatus Heimdallarchaeota archaeon]|nr:MAG: staygreen family protein [Candidatus Heimdallarchaeota archaeon]